MADIGDALYFVLLLAGPLAGYAWALRRSRPRVQVVLAAALGGAVPGGLVVVAAAAVALHGTPTSGVLSPSVSDLLVWPLATTATGAALGMCGLLARSLGSWLARRP